MLTVTSMKVTGSMIRLMDLVYILIWMELSMKETGNLINNMAKGRNHGLMELCMREIM